MYELSKRYLSFDYIYIFRKNTPHFVSRRMENVHLVNVLTCISVYVSNVFWGSEHIPCAHCEDILSDPQSTQRQKFHHLYSTIAYFGNNRRHPLKK